MQHSRECRGRCRCSWSTARGRLRCRSSPTGRPPRSGASCSPCDYSRPVYELVLRPSRIVYRLGAGFALLFGLIGAALLATGRLIGLFPLGIAAISAFASLTALVPGVAYLKLDARGYVLKSIRHSFRIQWTEVTGFRDTWLSTGGRNKTHVVEAS